MEPTEVFNLSNGVKFDFSRLGSPSVSVLDGYPVPVRANVTDDLTAIEVSGPFDFVSHDGKYNNLSLCLNSD